MTNNNTFEDYYKKAEKLYFFSLFNLMDNFLYEKIRTDRVWYLIPTDKNVINNIFHQSCEFFLKAKIKKYDNMININDILSKDLPEKLLTFESTTPLFNTFKTYYKKNRKLRNIDIHDVDKSIYIDEFKKDICEFINTYILFCDCKKFKKNLYTYIIKKYKEYNQYNNRYSKKTYFQLYIWLLLDIMPQLSTKDENNFKKVLKITEKYEKETKYFCPRCSKRSMIEPTEQSFFPSLDAYDIFINNEIKTLYKSKNNIFDCVCCGLKIKSELVLIDNCLVCNSIINSKNKSLIYNSKCIECSFENNKTPLISLLKNGYQEDNKTPPLRSFFDSFNIDLDYLMRCFDVFRNAPNPAYYHNVSAGYTLITESITSSCINYSLFKAMLVYDNKVDSNKIHTTNEKKEVYDCHKSIYSLEETITYAYFKYEDYMKKIFFMYKKVLNQPAIFWLMEYINKVSWYTIFLKIHDYYEYKIDNQLEYSKLELKYFGDNIDSLIYSAI